MPPPLSPLARIRAVAPPTAVAAGLIAVLVGVTSSAALVFTAARAAGADTRETSSWMLAIGVGVALLSVGLSVRYRAPIVTAWSTPGAALLATSLAGVSMAKAVGAFLFCAVLMIVSGVTGWFAKAMDRIPVPLASALLAGVLLHFGTGLFAAMDGSFAVVFPVFALYLLARRLLPRYAVLVALGAGVVASVLAGGWHLERIRLSLAQPVFTTPAFDWKVLISVGVPLFVVTMASQNLPGVAVLRNSGYDTPVSPMMTWIGVVQAVLAPFGAFGLNLAAITAAICTGEEAHPDRGRRYLAAVWSGVFYLCVGLLGATVVSLLAAMPHALVMAVAGVGLLATIEASLATALSDPTAREAAAVTFLATASGVTLLGIGSTFWGLLAGALTSFVASAWRPGRRPAPVPAQSEAGPERRTGHGLRPSRRAAS
ncbi:benzoate/H(+) symporter BenE family transporter [Streptomyces sp. VRA16 Mangrove soil]|uniref:benzoate/H(+) symporter BenE family transporter n=1 Tax=Streptomyces sp. VRA16 Mangrove soil TaxID=2817434 RepID=UPI001A9D06ED|nr:benzoate/H(+) symporter BenE family transporter [Streptomyces sp. VRA16 Mangrove soil]MBO1332868.1 benzoate/H(+) symporter BenE family transporter [Streptomyces sp. VRA16 Mangrove soil]